MRTTKKEITTAKPLLHRSWVQWTVAVVFFFLLSWLFMGNAINNCSTTSTALGSDTTGGFVWIQSATGNDLTWRHTDKSNYPYGETLGRPQYVTSTIFIGIYKVLAMLTTPICGMNLIVLLGYMSTGLLAFGLVRWLLRRFDIALFAGFAAAFVPFHQLKSSSHVNYIYGSLFIATIWAYLWFMSRPSYKRAIILGLVSSLGFYFDGYFVLISAAVIGGLFVAPFVLDLLRILTQKSRRKVILNQAVARLKYLLVAFGVLCVVLIPILVVYATSGDEITQSLAAVRSDIKVETITYGARPIEFIVPSVNSALVPNLVPWTVKSHNSNPSEDTLYIGYTVIVLALFAIAKLLYRKERYLKLQNLPYVDIVTILLIVFLACFLVSLPAVVVIFGHRIPTPTYILIKLTANWRVLSRLFLAMHPAVVVLASLGLHMLVKRWSNKLQWAVVGLCGLLLFLEYLPTPLHQTGNLYKDAPPIYKQIRADPNVNLMAEYPLAAFIYSPEIFTFQQLHDKKLLNASDIGISRGQRQGSIAGLSDPQTLGALKTLGVDVIITHGFNVENNPSLDTYTKPTIVYNGDGTINLPATKYAYKLNHDVQPINSLLTLKQGYESLSVDNDQISHRFIASEGIMAIFNLKSTLSKQAYNINFDVASACPTAAVVTISQAGKTIWQGQVSNTPTPIVLTVDQRDIHIKTVSCSIDITRMSAALVP